MATESASLSRSLLLRLACTAAVCGAAPALAQSYGPPTDLPRPEAAYVPAAYVETAAGPDDADAQAAPPTSPSLAEPSAPPAAAAPVTADRVTPSAGADQAGAADDPFEKTNRKLYDFNHAVDARLIRPGVVFYHHATPTPVRHGIGNALSNLNEPIIFINDVLQLRPKNAAKSLGRFVLNSVVGIGGFIDVASRAGVPFHNADFGETLGRYGVPTGPYLFIPILGPVTLRDGAGRIVDGFVDPFNSINYGTARDVLAPTRLVVGAIDARDQVDPLLKEIDRTATDPYGTTRSLYLQNRRSLVNGGAADTKSVKALPDFGPAPADAAPTPPASAPAPSPST